MGMLGVRTVDTRDSCGRAVFHGLAPEDLLSSGPFRDEMAWYPELLAYPIEKVSTV